MIPDFDHNNVLPPYLGDPTRRKNLSPYHSNMIEVAQRFATSNERIEILTNFINFRKAIRASGMNGNAVQWLDGSFVENIESIENRPPRDIDVLTFFYGYNEEELDELVQKLPEFQDPIMSKDNYKVDHYPIEIDSDPIETLYSVKYWTMLFTHNRIGIWKGIIEVKIDTPDEDEQALVYLQNIKL